MRFWNLVRWLLGEGQKLPDLIAAVADSDAALTKRLDSMQKQLDDLRAVVAALGETAKQKPTQARNMAELRRFTGDVD